MPRPRGKMSEHDPATVLVVDDDKESRSRLGNILRTAGHQVLAAAHGKEAVRLLAAHKVDIVATDLMMPEMDGIELIRFLHRGYPRVKIIAFAGCLDQGLLKVATLLGASASLTMPISPGDLLTLVDSLFDPET